MDIRITGAICHDTWCKSGNLKLWAFRPESLLVILVINMKTYVGYWTIHYNNSFFCATNCIYFSNTFRCFDHMQDSLCENSGSQCVLLTFAISWCVRHRLNINSCSRAQTIHFREPTSILSPTNHQVTKVRDSILNMQCTTSIKDVALEAHR